MRIIYTILLLLISSVLYGQNVVTTNITIQIKGLLSMIVIGSPTLIIDTELKYFEGTKVEVDNHLEVASNRPYIISVTTTGYTTNPSLLEIGTVKITAGEGSGGGRYTGITSYPTVILSNVTSNNIVNSSQNSFNTGTRTKFKIKYEVGLNKEYFDKNEGINIIPVIYTITHQ